MNLKKITITIILLWIVVIVVLIVYHYFDPTHSIYAPKCLLKMLTGYDCPGCGCQRLLYHWAHGRFLQGWRYNYFFPVGIVYIALILIGRRIPRLHYLFTSATTIYIFIAMYVLWWVLRNLLHI